MIESFPADIDRSIGWTRDSKAVVYDTPKNGASELYLQPIDGSAARWITDFRNDSIFWFDWSSDGQRWRSSVASSPPIS